MNLPTGIRGRALAVLLVLLLVCAVVAAVAVPAYLLHHRYSEARAAAENRIDRYQRIASSKVEHQRALDVIKARESGRFFLKNSAPNLGGAELTDMVRPLLESNAARLTSIQPVTVRDEGGFRVYSLNVGFNGTPAALQKALYAIETAIPYLFVETATLRATVPRGYKPPPNQEPEVTVQIEVQAYGPKSMPARGVAPAAVPVAAPASPPASGKG
jgi:general secretion pathway protein M